MARSYIPSLPAFFSSPFFLARLYFSFFFVLFIRSMRFSCCCAGFVVLPCSISPARGGLVVDFLSPLYLCLLFAAAAAEGTVHFICCCRCYAVAIVRGKVILFANARWVFRDGRNYPSIRLSRLFFSPRKFSCPWAAPLTGGVTGFFAFRQVVLRGFCVKYFVWEGFFLIVCLDSRFWLTLAYEIRLSFDISISSIIENHDLTNDSLRPPY